MTRDELIEELKKLPTNLDMVVVTSHQERLSDGDIGCWRKHPITAVYRPSTVPLNIIQVYDRMSD